MSGTTEANKVEDIEFKWGKKRGVGGKKKEVRFYESFTYDGLEYSLYDSVYMYKEGEPEPYIGKLIKIWENADKTKKVKVLWFFRPSEILNWLGNEQPPENEIFMASGEGVGLANVNPLEAIAGKCNVVCTSKDSRNLQPSVEELRMADYIFYRTFDVGNCTILDKMDDKVAGIEVKLIFNRKGSETSPVPQLADMKEDIGNVIPCRNSSSLVVKEDKTGKASLVEAKTGPGDKPVSDGGEDSCKLTTTNYGKASVCSDKSFTGDIKSSDDNRVKGNKVPLIQVTNEAEGKSAKDSGAVHDKPSKRVRADNSAEVSDEKVLDDDTKLASLRKDVKASMATVTSAGDKRKAAAGKDLHGQDKGVKSPRDSGAREGTHCKKARVDSSGKSSDNNDRDSVQKLVTNSDRIDQKELAAINTSVEGKMKSGQVKDSLRQESGLPRKLKPGETKTKFSNGELLKISSGMSPDEDNKREVREVEVTRRPEADKSKWFKELPWEERARNAHEKGTLVLIENLDPAYTSEEVEDIIWHGFGERCAAKMVQRTAISSPYSGQALVILKTREAADRIVRDLDKGCLMLSNGRPLVGSVASLPSLSGKQPTFFGHLTIDKMKLQNQREMKQAVSTSHCSQPNTIEYEMAMEWCLLQARSQSWWNSLYKQQGEQLRKLKSNLKSR